ncbi:oligopeptide/dipeptide ABC transporter, ATP-binding protein-like protein, partial [mine drainage metagenome]
VYDTDKGPLNAVDDVSFTLEAGKMLGIVGESGSGKTALCRSIIRLFPTTHVHVKGNVLLSGEDLLGRTESELRQIWGTQVAIVFQDPMTSLSPLMRIGHQVAEGLRIHLNLSRQAAKKRSVSILRSVGIPDAEERARRYPHQLSGGLRQRAAIA